MIVIFFTVMFLFVLAVIYELRHTYRDKDLWKK